MPMRDVTRANFFSHPEARAALTMDSAADLPADFFTSLPYVAEDVALSFGELAAPDASRQCSFALAGSFEAQLANPSTEL